MITLQAPDTKAVEAQAPIFLAQATSLVIESSNDWQLAVEQRKRLKSIKDGIEKLFEEPKAKAFAAHRSLTATEKKLLAPVQEADRIVERKMTAYHEQQRALAAAEAAKRLEEQKAAIEAARREAEDRALATAQTLAQNGNQALADAVLATPVIVTAPIVEAVEEEKLEGSYVRTTYSAEVTDIKALCQAVLEGKVSEEAVVGNIPFLNKLASALKEHMQVAGVVVRVNKKTVTKG